MDMNPFSLLKHPTYSSCNLRGPIVTHTTHNAIELMHFVSIREMKNDRKKTLQDWLHIIRPPDDIRDVLCFTAALFWPDSREMSCQGM